MKNKSANIISAENVARYFLSRSEFDGGLISPLQMQKLIYYAYVWTLIRKNKKLFDEKFEAWPNGPVLPSLYKKLKKYGSSPIDGRFLNIKNHDELAKLKKSVAEIIEILDQVYEEYGSKTAFELVTMTHNEKPWKTARKGLSVAEPSNNKILDRDIISEYGKR